VKIGLLAGEREAAPLLRLLRQDIPTGWHAATLDEARLLAQRRPVDALVASTAALQGATRGLGSLGLPVIVFRSDPTADGATAYEAMDAGAIYAFSLPAEISEEQRQALLRALRLAATTPTSRPTPPAKPTPMERPAEVSKDPPLFLALGASTGGPAAVAELLRSMGPVPAAIVIVQHIEPSFTGDMAGWWASYSGIPVELSTSTLSPRPGRAILAATEEHLVATAGGQLRHAPAAPQEIHHPSVDALFHSLAAHARPGVAVLLTGMGSDGARGLLALRKAGWSTVAQDAATSAVDGMPRAARELGAALEVLPLDRIGPRVRRILGGPP
jgi:two-component system response regulator WspF